MSYEFGSHSRICETQFVDLGNALSHQFSMTRHSTRFDRREQFLCAEFLILKPEVVGDQVDLERSAKVPAGFRPQIFRSSQLLESCTM